MLIVLPKLRTRIENSKKLSIGANSTLTRMTLTVVENHQIGRQDGRVLNKKRFEPMRQGGRGYRRQKRWVGAGIKDTELSSDLRLRQLLD